MRILRLPVPVPVAVACLCLAPFARPQDSHYWTSHYGTRATLLGGAVIGSVLDLSGTYYNPGGMSLIKDPQTLMAAKVIQYPHIGLVGSDRRSVPFNSASLAPAPSLVAGTFKFRGLSKHWFGYSYLSRQDVKLGVSVSSTGTRDILPDAPGPEKYATQFRLEEKISEPWFGLTWSYRVAKNVGVGVSQYIAVRTQRASIQTLVETLDSGNSVAMALGARQYHYQNIRILWKIGLAFDFKWATMGLTLTTPGLTLSGTGSTGVNSTVVALDMDGDGVGDDFLAADYRNRQPVTFRTPVSLAAGATFKIQKVRVYWSAEWFAPISPYTVVDTAEFAAQSTGQLLSTDVTQELAAVLNMGIGLEWFYSSRFKGYASYSTDYSAKEPGTATNISLTDWDIQHLITGAEIAIKNSALTVGLGYSFGSREIGSRPDIIEREELVGFWDPFESLKFRYSTYKLIVGFAF
ncbi:MAG: hypothetical protein NT147_06075 [Candidatus Aminicenantes bacterium]|nr:hypothetical protein [Candidatus Aminicenantes bacterium]